MRGIATGLVVVGVLAACASPSGGSAASCVGPIVDVSPVTFSPGDEVRIGAKYMLTDCYDTGQAGTPPPMKAVEFRLVTSGGAGRTFSLATQDADPTGRIESTVRIPDDVPAGPARLEAKLAKPVPVQVTAR